MKRKKKKRLERNVFELLDQCTSLAPPTLADSRNEEIKQLTTCDLIDVTGLSATKKK